MAWVTAFKVYCPLAKEEVALLEDRQYEQGEGTYIVLARRCSFDVACNLNEHLRCKWNFKPGGSDADPFQLAEDD